MLKEVLWMRFFKMCKITPFFALCPTELAWHFSSSHSLASAEKSRAAVTNCKYLIVVFPGIIEYLNCAIDALSVKLFCYLTHFFEVRVRSFLRQYSPFLLRIYLINRLFTTDVLEIICNGSVLLREKKKASISKRHFFLCKRSNSMQKKIKSGS